MESSEVEGNTKLPGAQAAFIGLVTGISQGSCAPGQCGGGLAYLVAEKAWHAGVTPPLPGTRKMLLSTATCYSPSPTPGMSTQVLPGASPTSSQVGTGSWGVVQDMGPRAPARQLTPKQDAGGSLESLSPGT